jgi:hypothetical protein
MLWFWKNIYKNGEINGNFGSKCSNLSSKDDHNTDSHENRQSFRWKMVKITEPHDLNIGPT